ncbi:hypothetical protein [Burkholderia metallica]|uniref:hypothetical protein n=1 Tax=Burkholderia metallica TaxID=488729 RepID=UPI001CF152DE|nr:hypothetical protein [Burkholderia metallica]MCA8017728.1 hypothetical protein [Burkholderia metallica]
MSTKIFAQRDLSFGHLQGVLQLLPDAVAELGGGASNPMAVAQGISSVASGTEYRFFAVLVVDDVIAGFMAGILETDVFLARRNAREVFCYLRPSARQPENRSALLEAFEVWGMSQKADRLECVGDVASDDRYTAVATSRGYARASVVLRKML